MHRKLICLISLVLLLCLANTAPAWDIHREWDNGASTSDWNTGTNWDTDTVPDATSNTVIRAGSNNNGNYPTITGTGTAAKTIVGYEEPGFDTAVLTIDNAVVTFAGDDLSIGYDREEIQVGGEWGYFNIGRGAVYAIDSTVTIGDDLRPGRYGVGLFEMTNSTVTSDGLILGEKGLRDGDELGYPGLGIEAMGTLTVNSGSYTIASWAHMAEEESSRAYLNLHDGTVECQGLFEMATGENAEAYINLYGGTFKTAGLEMQEGIISATSIIDIYDGAELILDGYWHADSPYISDGWITAHTGSLGYTWADGTTTLIPEPATMLLLGLGSLFMLRRKR